MTVGSRRGMLAKFVFFVVCGLPWVATASTDKKISPTLQPPQRPDLVTDSIAKNKDIYYFGLGSNMLRSKLENRSVCGKKIVIKSMEPAVVENYRLAFNMRGFPPLEPGMGSLEPVKPDEKEHKDQSKPLVAYKENQCHGALVRLSPSEYEKVMRSEGVGSGRNDQGYEEIVVEAKPYKKGRKSVQAVALRAREHVRLKADPAPSRRYMQILREGGNELKLSECYQEFLEKHPVSMPSPLLRKIAVFNLVWTVTLSFRLKIRIVSKMQSFFLWKVYAPPTSALFVRLLSELATILILLPGAIPGSLLLLYMHLRKKMSPMMETMIKSHW